MTEFLQILFWLSLWLTFYIYFGYFILIWLVSRFYPEPEYEEPDEYPKISMIIAAYNEEKVIEQKIQNCLSLDYPPELLEILIGTDGSTDRTGDILTSLNDARISCQVFEKRSGKNWMLNILVKESKGDILVFSDANIILENQTLKHLVSPFLDTSIGAVIGKLKLSSSSFSGSRAPEENYWNIENILKKNESRISTTFGITGAIYAIRKLLYRELPFDIPVADDTVTKLSVLKSGLRIVLSEKAVAIEAVKDDIFIEMKRRIRICAANLNSIKFFSSLLHPKNGYIALGIWSHKIFRWLAPFPLIAMFLTSYLLKDISLYREVFLFELGVIVFAVFGILLNILKIKVKYLTYAAYFFVINFGLLVGFFKFLFGTQKPYWEPTDRP